MKWFYTKDGQQIGPVDFAEIERLHAEGQISGDTLVWQQGTPNWVKFSTLSASPAGAPLAAPALPAQPAASSKRPDYGDFLCWGIFGILIPCAGLAIYIALLVLHVIELVAVRKEVKEGRLQSSTYSEIHPALYVVGLFCCGLIFYPLFMHYRNRAGYFKPQPHAVWVAIVAIVLCLIIGGASASFQASLAH